MKPVYQNKNGADGDCLRACIASIFEMNIDEVPDFVNDFSEWFDALWYWLRFRGYRMHFKKNNNEDDSFGEALNRQESFDSHVIVQVDSLHEDWNHVCIYSTKEKRIVHDPGGSRACEILQPPILGFYEIIKAEN